MTRLPRLISLALIAIMPTGLQAETCIAEDFEDFLPLFSESVTLQQKSIADPLLTSYLDFEHADPDPVEVIRKTPLNLVKYPVLKPLGELDTTRLMATTNVEGDKAELLISGLESGEYTTWQFSRSPCWTLDAIVDQSM